ncbi:MAG: hypothetical protein ACR2GH_02315 [Pseudonocardia sp.]
MTHLGSTTLTRQGVAAAAVPGAARVGGVCVDAVVTVDPAEHARRDAVGLRAVPDHGAITTVPCGGDVAVRSPADHGTGQEALGVLRR